MSASYERGDQEELKVNIEDSQGIYRRPTEKEIQDCRPCRFCVVGSFIILLVGLLVSSIVLIAVTDKCAHRVNEPKADASLFYEIDIRSFAGSFNDTTERIDYIKRMGIQKVILSGVVSSRNLTHSDIGSSGDFSHLVKSFHESKIQVILNFQPITVTINNTWFLESQRNSSKRDWFVWQLKNESNNWLNRNGTTAWYDSEESEDYLYYSYFGQEKPMLNYNNKDVIDQMVYILKQWLMTGIDGFFMPFVSRLAVDEKLRNNENGMVYDRDVEQSHKVLEVLFQVINVNGGSLYVSPDTDAENMLSYLGTKESRQSHVVFNDYFGTVKSIDVSGMSKNLKSLQNLSFGSVGWLTGGPAYHRLSDRIADQKEAKVLLFFALLFPYSVQITSGDEALRSGEVNSEWSKEGDQWLPKNKPIEGFYDLVNNRSSLDVFHTNPTVLYAENQAIVLLYDNKVVAGANFAGAKLTISNMTVGKNGVYLFNTNQSMINKEVQVSSDLELNPYEVALIKLV